MRKYDDNYLKNKDTQLSLGKTPHEAAPFTFDDIASLVAFLTIDISDQERHKLLAYYFGDKSWQRVSKKCRMSKDQWFRFRKQILERYDSFRRR